MALYVAVVIPARLQNYCVDELKRRLSPLETGESALIKHSVAGVSSALGRWVSFDGPIELVDRPGTINERVGYCCSNGFIVSINVQFALVLYFVKWTRFIRSSEARNAVISSAKNVIAALDCDIGYLTHDQSRIVTLVLKGAHGDEVSSILASNEFVVDDFHALGLSSNTAPSVDDKLLVIER